MTGEVMAAYRATLLKRIERKLRQGALMGLSLTGALLVASGLALAVVLYRGLVAVPDLKKLIS